jgi:hypothetical protein
MKFCPKLEIALCTIDFVIEQDRALKSTGMRLIILYWGSVHT